MKILVLTNIPSPYRVDFFNEWGKYCDLTVAFEKEASDERDNSWKKYQFTHFKGVLLKGKSVKTDMAICTEVIHFVKDPSFDRIIVMNLATPTGMLAIQYMKMHQIRYWIESDGGFSKKGRGLKERIKHYFVSGAEGYFSTNQKHDEYYQAYGAEADRIHRYPFSPISESEIISSEGISEKEKHDLRVKLGIQEGFVIVAVGQFIRRKGFDVLLKSDIELQQENVQIYIVGGKPSEEYLKLVEEYQLKNVHFISFKNKKEIREYYRAADLFVLPTREDIWGLVINEALANGLPVITTKRCGAGLQMLSEKEVGCLVDVDDTQALTKAILDIKHDPVLKEHMSQNAIAISRQYTIEKMVERHISVLNC